MRATGSQEQVRAGNTFVPVLLKVTEEEDTKMIS
jgi:hypothetical protein